MKRVVALIGALSALTTPTYAATGPQKILLLGSSPCSSVAAEIALRSSLFCQNGGRYSSLTSLRGLTYTGSVSGTGATTRSAATAGGYISFFANNVPRVTDRGWLIETAATNLQTYSTPDFTQSGSWTADGTTLTNNAAADPSGANAAGSIVEVATTAQHRLLAIGPTASTPNTISFFAKANGRRIFQLTGGGLGGGATTMWWDIVAGTTGVVGTGLTPSSTITPLANGWYRCTATFTPTSASVWVLALSDYTSSASVTATAESYAGDITKGILFYGAQLELASAASSYIPTTSASVARSADAATLAYSPPGSAAIVSYGTNSTASPSPTSPINLGSSSSGVWVGNYITKVLVSK